MAKDFEWIRLLFPSASFFKCDPLTKNPLSIFVERCSLVVIAIFINDILQQYVFLLQPVLFKLAHLLLSCEHIWHINNRFNYSFHLLFLIIINFRTYSIYTMLFMRNLPSGWKFVFHCLNEWKTLSKCQFLQWI